MSESNLIRNDINEEESTHNMGEKKFHSETSLQKFADDEYYPETPTDPGVQNMSITSSAQNLEDFPERRRTMSQPGPISGGLLTATAARTARKRQPRNVVYASDIDKGNMNDRFPRSISNNDLSLPPTPIGERHNPNAFIYRNGDIKSLNSYRMPLNDMREATTPRKRSVVTMDAQSIRSVETHAPPPTSPEDNARLSKKYLSLILSCIYAVLLVTLGFIIFPADPFVDLSISPSIVYAFCLLGIGFIYQIFLLIDINRYKTLALKNQKTKGLHDAKLAEYFRKQEEEYASTGELGDRTPDLNKSLGFPTPVLIPLNHDYCFSFGRHSGSFYLKLGAAGFALGHLVHSVLLIVAQVSYIYDETINNDDCLSIPQVVFDIVQPLYCFIQLYFIFKYSNVLILRAQSMAHFGFMHMIGSSLCFWIFNIVRETVLSITIYQNNKNQTDDNDTSADDILFNFGTRLSNDNCRGSLIITSIVENLSPYLYPFGVEFNILIVAVYYIIWSNIGNCENIDSTDGNSSYADNQMICKIPTANEENDYTSNIVIHADCHASNKGLFLGLILTVIVIGNLILGFVMGNLEEEFRKTGYTINNIAMLSMHTIMLVAVVICFNQSRKLDINEHPISLLDDILLFVCLPAFFMETVLSMIAVVDFGNIIKSVDYMVMVIQVVIQTTFIVDALRRCSNSRKLRRLKPAREILMFLLIANVAMWIMYTFSFKSPESLDERYKFYGKILWSILGHISLPLIMFYRFHSSVCFSDIWDAAYKPGSDH